jgi:hypothetical protein
MNINNIDELLIKLSISPSYKGYDYIVDAVTNWPEYKHSGITEAYIIMGKRYNTRPASIERCIRHAKEVALLKCPSDLQSEVFGPGITEDGNLTNKGFIALLSLYYEKRCKNG